MRKGPGSVTRRDGREKEGRGGRGQKGDTGRETGGEGGLPPPTRHSDLARGLRPEPADARARTHARTRLRQTAKQAEAGQGCGKQASRHLQPRVQSTNHNVSARTIGAPLSSCSLPGCRRNNAGAPKLPGFCSSLPGCRRSSSKKKQLLMQHPNESFKGRYFPSARLQPGC